MLRIPSRYGLCASLLLLPFIFSSAGCGTSATKDGANATPATASSKTGADCCASHGPQSQPANSVNEADSDVSEELAKLPPEDRALAEKQKVCPVTDAPLGSMGVPFKVTVRGRTVFLCCGGCQEKLNKNADEYLTKLERAETK
jgi:hypothetical protein